MSRNQRAAGGAVVITGASTGIGRACALHADSLGFHVFAGVRKISDGEMLNKITSGRITPVILDVTDAASIANAVEIVAAAVGEAGLVGLVNNAGIVIAGPLEFLPLDEIRKQFEVNVFGQIAVTQAFLPLLRKARGRVINMGSISGRVASPFIGPYAASKFALEAVTDSLRMELLPWGIPVSIIEPGGVATPIWEKSIASADKTVKNFPPQALHLYGSTLMALRKAAEKIGRSGIPPEAVVRAVAHALTARRPRIRYIIGWKARLRAMLKKFFPDRMLDRLTMRSLDLPGKPVP